MKEIIWYFPKIRVPQYRPQYIIVLIMGTPNKVPLIVGNPHIESPKVGLFRALPMVAWELSSGFRAKGFRFVDLGLGFRFACTDLDLGDEFMFWGFRIEVLGCRALKC